MAALGYNTAVVVDVNWILCCCQQSLQDQPNYLILVDTRDRPKQLTTYVAQDNLQLLQRTVVGH